MSLNFYSEINLHIVWHTKESAPLLTPEVEAFVHQSIRQRLVDTPDVFVHEVGGIETHVHVCLSLAPTILISELVGALKGGSSHEVNQRLGHALITSEAQPPTVPVGPTRWDFAVLGALVSALLCISVLALWGLSTSTRPSSLVALDGFAPPSSGICGVCSISAKAHSVDPTARSASAPNRVPLRSPRATSSA